MTGDEIVALGSFCENLTCHSAWAVVVEQFEQHCFQRIMTPHEQKKHEGIYKKQTTAATDWRCRLLTLMTNGPLMIATTMTSPTYVQVTCLACAQAHLVNPKSGKVLGTADDE